jgi:hypothetical protein
MSSNDHIPSAYHDPGSCAVCDEIRKRKSTADATATVGRRDKVMELLADRAVWGFACHDGRQLLSQIVATPDAVEPVSGLYDLNDVRTVPVPMMVIRSLIGDPLVVVLAPYELAALGPCPNL